MSLATIQIGGKVVTPYDFGVKVRTFLDNLGKATNIKRALPGAIDFTRGLYGDKVTNISKDLTMIQKIHESLPNPYDPNVTKIQIEDLNLQKGGVLLKNHSLARADLIQRILKQLAESERLTCDINGDSGSVYKDNGKAKIVNVERQSKDSYKVDDVLVPLDGTLYRLINAKLPRGRKLHNLSYTTTGR